MLWYILLVIFIQVLNIHYVHFAGFIGRLALLSDWLSCGRPPLFTRAATVRVDFGHERRAWWAVTINEARFDELSGWRVHCPYTLSFPGMLYYVWSTRGSGVDVDKHGDAGNHGAAGIPVQLPA